jgi:hypothetical protein
MLGARVRVRLCVSVRVIVSVSVSGSVSFHCPMFTSTCFSNEVKAFQQGIHKLIETII